MGGARGRECLQCGMVQDCSEPEPGSKAQPCCTKCDAPLYSQSDGSTLNVDIAHQHETVREAVQKMEEALALAWSGHTGRVRLVVGGGLIRDAVLAELHFMHNRGRILDYAEELRNRGAVIVTLRGNYKAP